LTYRKEYSLPTIKDIARETGFSFKTVSRALNGEKGVSEKSAMLIKKKAHDLGYVANSLAGSLKSGKTGLIGILTGPLGLDIKSKKLYAIQRELENLGKKSLLSCSDLDRVSLSETLPAFFSLVDGVIVLQPPNDPGLFSLLKQFAKPILLVDGFSDGIPSLTIDRERGVLEALSRLHNGYERFMYLNSLPGRFDDGRYRGFNQFTSAPEFSKEKIVKTVRGETFEDGRQEGHQLDDSLFKERRTLIFCTNDQLALGLMKGLCERGINVPGQVGVIGFNGDDYGPYLYKSLATVKQPVEELGLMTGEILENLLRGTAKRKVYSLTTRFVPGESV
jgi:LacI family transcriptional regulator